MSSPSMHVSPFILGQGVHGRKHRAPRPPTGASEFTMRIASSRFGNIDIPEHRILSILTGMLGFPELKTYALHLTHSTPKLAWLQSIDVPEVAFAVIESRAFGPDYPSPSPAQLWIDRFMPGSPPAHAAVLVHVFTKPVGDEKPRTEWFAPLTLQPALCANLLSPIIVDFDSKIGFQALLHPCRYEADHVLPAAFASELVSAPRCYVAPRLAEPAMA
jgi:flagellar assembly factor FliW